MHLGLSLGKSGVYLGFWTPVVFWFLKHIITVRQNRTISVRIISRGSGSHRRVCAAYILILQTKNNKNTFNKVYKKLHKI